jgi:hypothetical protein
MHAGHPVRRGLSIHNCRLWNTGSPAFGFADDDGGKGGAGRDYAATAGTGSAVTDLIFSIAKRDVTFLSGTVAISFL